MPHSGQAQDSEGGLGFIKQVILGAIGVRFATSVPGRPPPLGPITQRKVRPDPKNRKSFSEKIGVGFSHGQVTTHGGGTQFALENPADRGDRAAARAFLHSEHGSIWQMPEMQKLRAHDS